MDTLKIILLTFFSVVATAVVTILMWTCLYLTIPNIKTNTDKLFKWNDYSVEQEQDNTVETTQNIQFKIGYNN